MNMKKIIFILLISAFMISCAAYKSLDLNKLSTGMSKEQVETVMGQPDRILAINNKEEGLQEVLEYRTSGDDVYALEFWNDYLTGYEFLYEDVTYVPPMAPPVIWPDYGRPIYVIPGNRPNRPNRPNKPNRPNRPEIDRSDMTKPTPGVGPSRPVYNSNSGSTSSSNSNQRIDRSKLAR